MKTLFVEEEFLYDGSQLKHLFAYLNYKILGDSVVSWVGPCNVTFENMADGEDFIASAEIRGGKMLHFIIEKYDIDFFAGVAFQRLITSLCIDVLKETSLNKEISNGLRRSGDDIYFKNQKLSISIAKKLINSVVIHFAINITNEGTPVETLCLAEMSVDPIMFAEKLLNQISKEAVTITQATQKVF